QMMNYVIFVYNKGSCNESHEGGKVSVALSCCQTPTKKAETRGSILPAKPGLLIGEKRYFVWYHFGI
ncbi:MAG: hypothetical protein KDE29_23755, partial [Anaerolineales bacterium]|nr:hypothetical protein [Anaerolineales bacterium]